ncbi:hypothetical protein N7468_003506 [Penicillium chermesinum]|uniref:Uncharacterized protein n=1 Tax=Penicillium chermesinum TaxID=63820 RepID=A0A9W9P9D1_9EURO|nr:uncharacterized protein N7468_003506 [Penicillium chermesinum]KAJ5238887.1 hypothetical protein N7468_003506 [Penicillium chermesinum]
MAGAIAFKAHMRTRYHDESEEFIQDLSAYTLKAVEAIYWDINFVSQLRASAQNKTNEIEKRLYERALHYAYRLAYNCAHASHKTPSGTNDRGNRGMEYRGLRLTVIGGWKLLGICAYAESFHKISKIANESQWECFEHLLTSECDSIKIFASSRGLEWRAPLNALAQQDAGILKDLGPQINIAQEHPHHTVQTRDGGLKRPVYSGCAQVNAGSNIYNPHEFRGSPPNPPC